MRTRIITDEEEREMVLLSLAFIMKDLSKCFDKLSSETLKASKEICWFGVLMDRAKRW